MLFKVKCSEAICIISKGIPASLFPKDPPHNIHLIYIWKKKKLDEFITDEMLRHEQTTAEHSSKANFLLIPVLLRSEDSCWGLPINPYLSNFAQHSSAHPMLSSLDCCS